MAHTEGPWRWREEWQGTVVRSTDGEAVAWVSERRGTSGGDIANARLIAAAPEYDEAARAMLEGLRELPEGYFCALPMPLQKKLTRGWVGLEEAIAKTEGRP